MDTPLESYLPPMHGITRSYILSVSVPGWMKENWLVLFLYCTEWSNHSFILVRCYGGRGLARILFFGQRAYGSKVERPSSPPRAPWWRSSFTSHHRKWFRVCECCFSCRRSSMVMLWLDFSCFGWRFTAVDLLYWAHCIRWSIAAYAGSVYRILSGFRPIVLVDIHQVAHSEKARKSKKVRKSISVIDHDGWCYICVMWVYCGSNSIIYVVDGNNAWGGPCYRLDNFGD